MQSLFAGNGDHLHERASPKKYRIMQKGFPEGEAVSGAD